MYVVPGDKRDGEIDGVWHIENTRKYIEEFGRLFDGGRSSDEVYQEMLKLCLDRFNHAALKRRCDSTFKAVQS